LISGLHSGIHALRCLRLQDVGIKPHARPRDACLGPDGLVVVSDGRKQPGRHPADGNFTQGADIARADDRADFVVQHVVHVHEFGIDHHSRIVDQRHVIQQATQQGCGGVLVVHDDFHQRTAEEGVRLGIHFKHGERHFVAEFVVQHFIAAAAAQEFVKARNARALNVHLHVGFGQCDLAHGRVVGVLVRVAGIPALALKFFFLVNAAVGRAGHVVDFFKVVAHGHHIAHARLSAVAADVGVLNAGCVPVHKEVFRRHRVDADFLAAGFLGDLQVIHRGHDGHAHFVDDGFLRDFLFQDFNLGVHAKQLNLIFGQVAVFIDFDGGGLVNVNLPDADLLLQRVIDGVGQDLKAVVALENIGRIICLLLGFLHGLRLARDELHRAAGLQENPHQRRLDRADGIPAFRGDNSRSAVFRWQINLAVKVFLRPDAIRRNLGLNEADRLHDGVLDRVLDLVAG